MPSNLEFNYEIVAEIRAEIFFSILMSSSIHSNFLVFKDLGCEDHVSAKQIHSLYSRWSKKYREVTLKPLSENSINYEGDLDENHDVDDEDCVYQNMISRHAEKMMLKIDFKIDSWVAVKYNEMWFSGVIVEVLFF